MTRQGSLILEESPVKATEPAAARSACGCGAGGLLVFADDWGRHPSSAQHLVRRLLESHPTLWVNTVGTRRPRLTRADLGRVAGRVRQWVAPGGGGAAVRLPDNLRVTSPRMYPGFRAAWQRRLNARLLTRQLEAALADTGPRPHVAVTTLPITADLVGRLPVERWVYYCVDDFAAWPGLDAPVMRAMERELVERVDEVVAVSDTLVQRIASLGRRAALLTHGVDLDHWSRPRVQAEPPWPRPLVVFWGLIDPRLDAAWCRALSDALSAAGGTLLLVGPQQSPDAQLAALPHTHMPGPMAYDELPALAQQADVLAMPYADLPVTRAMQPLKLKEYLATGRPVVVRDLPATRPWADAADVVTDADACVARVLERLRTGLPEAQANARRRLEDETWDAKAKQFEAILFGEGGAP